MTVRTWVTLSVLVVLALGAAAAVFFFSPISHPELLATYGEDQTRLEGRFDGACWPQRGNELRCRRPPEDRSLPDGPVLLASGEIRLLAVFPVQPDDGTIRIVDANGREALEEEWRGELPYELTPGSYVLEAEARYEGGAYVRYRFPFQVGG